MDMNMSRHTQLTSAYVQQCDNMQKKVWMQKLARIFVKCSHHHFLHVWGVACKVHGDTTFADINICPQKYLNARAVIRINNTRCWIICPSQHVWLNSCDQS